MYCDNIADVAYFLKHSVYKSHKSFFIALRITVKELTAWLSFKEYVLLYFCCATGVLFIWYTEIQLFHLKLCIVKIT